MASPLDYLLGPLGHAAKLIPGVGTAVDKVGNVVTAPIKAAATSTPARNEQVPLYTPQQQEAILRFLQAGTSGLGQLGQLGQQQFRVPSSAIGNLFNQTLGQAQAGFAPIAQQARENFYTQTVPSIAERFGALGGNSTRMNSGNFIGALGSAGRGLERDLAALGAQYGQNQQSLNQSLLGQLLGSQAQQFGQQGQLFSNLAQLGLISPFQNQFHPRIPSLLENLGTSAAYGLGRAGSAYLGGGLF